MDKNVTNRTNTQPLKIANSIRPYLNEIADRLWSGHAAIMVGAGFSKNAKPNSTSCTKFPDWTELGDLFYEKVHGEMPGDSRKYMNVLKLADEVQAALGRPVLDQLLRNVIPDLDYEPSALHTKLLELPWADIFTTNYDTLLERAAVSISSQRFDVVVNKEDLVYSEQPRIIKLHGSFPSERPFIITEEDYRRYPKEYAPFVNTVQQSLLENTLCLVGFSGDDPNFLQWIGWIRDNLGHKSSPKIYLVGVVNLSNAQKKLLEARNTVVINMADCASVGAHGYYEGLERFFDYLMSKKDTENALGWPYESSKLSPDLQKDKLLQAQATLAKWKEQRNSYPGWVVVPQDRRETLWNHTEHWCRFINKIGEISDKIAFEWIYELVWRMNKCLCPLFNDQVEFITAILDKYRWMFFPKDAPSPTHDTSARAEDRLKWIELKIHLMRYYREEGFHPEWDTTNGKIASIWGNLSAYQQASVYYERALFALFSIDIPELRKRIAEWPVNESLPHMEAKRAMLLAEIGEVNEAASILSNSLEQIRSKLNLKPVSNDYSLVSQESYVMLLYKFVKDAAAFLTHLIAPSENEIEDMRKLFFAKFDIQDEQATAHPSRTDRLRSIQDIESTSRNPKEEWQKVIRKSDATTGSEHDSLLRQVRNTTRLDELRNYHNRWDDLKKYKCDPWDEVRIFTAQLEQSASKPKAVTETPDFDIGKVSQTHHLCGGDKEALTGYAFLRFLEDTGIVFRIPGCNFSAKSGAGALTRISDYSPSWATASLLRLGDPKLADLLYDRQALSKMSQDQVDHLIDIYLATLEKAQIDIAEGSGFYRDNFGILLAKIVPEILSRLATKCSSEKRFIILDFLKGVYESSDRSKYDKIGSLTKRLINSFDKSSYPKLITLLLEFPILGGLSVIEDRDFLNPLLFVEVPDDIIGSLATPDEELIERLVSIMENSDSGGRLWATLSLSKLYEWGLLNKAQESEFARVIWSKLDEHNLPAQTGFYRFAFLKMPHPLNSSVEERVREYLHKAVFPIQSKQTEKGVSILGGQIPLCHEILGANKMLDWRKVEIEEFTNQIIEWWDGDKDQLLKKNASESVWMDIYGEFKGRFSKMENLLARVIVPEARKHELEVSIEAARRILDELNDIGISALRLKVALSMNESDEINHAVSEINRLLSSNTRDHVIEAIHGIDLMVEMLNQETAPHIIKPVITQLALKIKWRHNCELGLSISVMSTLVRKFSSLFSNDVETDTLSGLISLAEETDYKFAGKDFSDRIFIREEAAGLAAELNRLYLASHSSIPDAIEVWQRICQSTDEFAEIRNRWI
ncbi:SIR2 family protein [Coraliomargarita sp. SDUM461003]|uniref:SIR2 family protein n=1 Tax=Thalassobacterium maritimum TaxID=3041265 RepID=A0ABU1AS30_9BACT|nr:anti-phage defense-associated sirtuin Dsr2 [Coraliomargarita sp. SDUM461003]MDQ8206963.1 SIR2 family protein [Coraliomargarita sp. SDUM461003]